MELLQTARSRIFWLYSTTFFLLVGYSGYYLCRNNISAAFPLLSTAFKFSNQELGYIAFYSELTYTVGKFINGPWIDQVGGKKFFIIGMLGTILCNVLFTSMSSLPGFIIVWCLCRYFLSMGWASLSSIVVNWYDASHYGRIMGFLSLSYVWGGVLSSLFSGFWVLRGASWQDLFIYPAIILGVISILSFFFIRSSPSGETHAQLLQRRKAPGAKSPENLRENLKQKFSVIYDLVSIRAYLYLLCLSFQVTFIRSLLLFWIPKMLVDWGADNSSAIFQSMLFPVLGTISTLFLGFYTDRMHHLLNRGYIVTILLIILSAFLIGTSHFISLAFSSHNALYLYTLLAMSGFFLLGTYSITSGCLALEIGGGENAATASSLVDGIGYCGGSLSLLITGYVADHYGWSTILHILAAFAMIGAGFSWMMAKNMLFGKPEYFRIVS